PRGARGRRHVVLPKLRLALDPRTGTVGAGRVRAPGRSTPAASGNRGSHGAAGAISEAPRPRYRIAAGGALGMRRRGHAPSPSSGNEPGTTSSIGRVGSRLRTMPYFSRTPTKA